MTHDEAIEKALELAGLPFQERRLLLRRFSDEDLTAIHGALGHLHPRKGATLVWSLDDSALSADLRGEQLARAMVENLNYNVTHGIDPEGPPGPPLKPKS